MELDAQIRAGLRKAFLAPNSPCLSHDQFAWLSDEVVELARLAYERGQREQVGVDAMPLPLSTKPARFDASQPNLSQGPNLSPGPR